MGRADYFALGDWNAVCDHCGSKRKGSTLRKQWNGLWACPEHWEPRQPQDFVKAVPEHPAPPFVRSPADLSISVCTPNGKSAYPGYAVPGCARPAYIHPAFDRAVSEPTP